ncbi:aminotransferase class III-fold pyridoxal phosphate-dependent enzyme [Gemmobacter sp. 24YEA27]|uniref:aminotransferase class III-fold pyridoxal phosphate-dependent enzyme n=1 Tax=Gemmobacter sp. 24YEA27 TaxID=3040672 RepID=UPI0024B39755|nr:aminotransferase class III-fold pyridoxal phosphate-dependent enzyme [Gemmobacter sp. 24YEA27]
MLDWGNLDQLRAVLDDTFAAVILEPVAINGGCFMPPAGYLEGLRDLTREKGVALIFDEVISGYRLGTGGAQALVGVTPDLSVIGKAMGAGFPISAVAGSRAAMEPVASGRMLHRGTFNGNPVSVAAAVACIRELIARQDEIFPRMEAQGADLEAHIRETAREAGLPLSVARTGSALQIFLGIDQVSGLGDLRGSTAPRPQLSVASCCLQVCRPSREGFFIFRRRIRMTTLPSPKRLLPGPLPLPPVEPPEHAACTATSKKKGGLYQGRLSCFKRGRAAIRPRGGADPSYSPAPRRWGSHRHICSSCRRG